MEFFGQINNYLNEFLMNAGILAPLLSCILIFLEGILAFLPLFVFITVNFLTVGPILGTILSWIFTVLGGFFTFYFCRKKLGNYFEKKWEKRPKLKKFMQRISKLKFVQILLIVAIPFTPSFFVNLGAGLSRIPVKKYLYALILGKLFIVIFWGYVGTSLLECLTNPVALIKVLVLVGVAYILGIIVNKKFDLDKRF